jgi:hypothetical protein
VDTTRSGRLKPHPRRLGSAVLSLVTAVAATVLVLGVVAPGVLAAALWSATRSPSVVADPSTTVKVTVTNLGTSGASDAIGCVKISVPSDVSVLSENISDISSGRAWTASSAGTDPTVVTAHAVTNGDWLRGGDPPEWVEIAVRAAPAAAGATQWTVQAFRTKNCTLPSADVIKLGLSVTVAPPPTPTPTPKPTPTPTPTPTPKSTPTPRPTPTLPPVATPTPRLTPTPPGTIPAPGATPAPTHAGPTPSAGDSTTPSITPSASPAATSTVTSGSGGIGGGSGGSGGSGSGAPGGPRVTGQPDTFTVGGTGAGGVSTTIRNLGPIAMGVEWGVPGVILGVPGLLLIVVILAQSLGGFAWLPVVRRKFGGFGFSRPWRRGRA